MEVGNGMATILRFNDGSRLFLRYTKEGDIEQARELAVDIQLDGEKVGYITSAGKVTIVTNTICETHHITEIAFTETQLMAIAFRAKEFKDRCVRIAQEQAQT